MSDFLYHTSCDNCGSSDAKAVYQGGSTFCFKCKRYTRGVIYGNNLLAGNSRRIGMGDEKQPKALPQDLENSFGEEAVEWAAKYEITVPDLLRSNASYSKSQRRLYFCWYDEENNLLGWQARTFGEKIKYISSGSLDTVLPIYTTKSLYSNGNREDVSKIQEADGNSGVQSCQNSLLLILVEDCLSAIKIAKTGCGDAMPCLTSSLSTSKLKRLVRLYGAFTVWLDGDMFPNAQKMVRQLQLMGVEARAIWSPLDPKCYDESNIRNILLTGKVS